MEYWISNLVAFLALGLSWNGIIYFKNLVDVITHARPGHRDYRLNQFDYVQVLYRRGYIPFYTLLTYKPFLNGYYKYKEEFPQSDSIDYCYYLSLKKFEGTT